MQELDLGLTTNPAHQPLAARLRPQNMDDFFGQSHLLAADQPLRRAIDLGQLHSMILWGPPGTGKTTLAKLLAQNANANFVSLSAVFAGVKDIRQVMEDAKRALGKTILFIDEIHRFNKAQQDAFLPFVEDGTVILIGATTENPSFELNNALLSRARVYVLKRLTDSALMEICQRAIADPERGYGENEVSISEQDLEKIVQAADGDARRALNLLEIALGLAKHVGHKIEVEAQHIEELFRHQPKQFDKGGDIFHDQISALHKSIRGSDPDASLYWFSCMIEGGCDPRYIARRVIRLASEDIGNADPRALRLSLDASETYERLGSPEGELAIAQAIVYCACCAKSNAVYTAFAAAREAAKQHGSAPVPDHLRNAPTKLMKELGYGKNYRYAHDEPDAYAKGERYLPEQLGEQQFYYPVERGLEIQIKEKLRKLKSEL